MPYKCFVLYCWKSILKCFKKQNAIMNGYWASPSYIIWFLAIHVLMTCLRVQIRIGCRRLSIHQLSVPWLRQECMRHCTAGGITPSLRDINSSLVSAQHTIWVGWHFKGKAQLWASIFIAVAIFFFFGFTSLCSNK